MVAAARRFFRALMFPRPPGGWDALADQVEAD
jgi:hypothetical protein